MDCPRVTACADLEAACARAVAMQAPPLPLIRAAADERIALLLIANAASQLPTGFLKSCRRPAVVLVGSDMGSDDDPPPTEWQCVARLRRWAQTVIVHGARGEPEHYRAAVAAAQLHRRVAFIERTGRQARAWAEALACPRTLLILPRDGAHPVVSASERVQ